jgi:transcriptional regulator with XRE-family HTH domain
VTKLQEVFASNLKAARKRAGFTQEILADKLGMSPKYLGTLERGLKFPSVAVIEQLAGALGVAAYELFMEPSAVTGSSPTEIIDAYNRFLEDKIREAGRAFLNPRDKTER